MFLVNQVIKTINLDLIKTTNLNKKKRKEIILKIEANTNKFNKFFSLQPRYGFSSMIVPNAILNRKKLL